MVVFIVLVLVGIVVVVAGNDGVFVDPIAAEWTSENIKIELKLTPEIINHFWWDREKEVDIRFRS